MSSRPLSQKTAQKTVQKTAQKTAQTTLQKPDLTTGLQTGLQTSRPVPDQELAAAEGRGADRVRAQVLELLREARRIVRVGEHQIEVIEVAALTELLAKDPD